MRSDAVFFITGGAHGIGAATAELAIARGKRVAVCDVDHEAAERLCERLGATSHAIHLDVRDPESWQQSLDRAWQHFGAVDVLVNNAGLIHSGRLAEQSLEQIHHMINVNLLGVILGLRAALPRLAQQGHGHVVNVASLASFAPLKGQVLYAATKHAVRALHHGVVLESEDLPVGFSLICPGAVDTGMLQHQIPHDSNAVSFAGRPLTPEQVAEAIYRAAERHPVEVLLPRFQGHALRLAGALPFLARPLARMAERQGLRALARLRQP